MDCMSQLHAIGEGDFFVSCLLHLSPEDLKACRLVNKTWNDLIKERVWGNKRARKRLEDESRQDNIKVKLWKEELFKQDIELPGVSANHVKDVVLESPFLVVGGTSRPDG